jgi:hypothetical protein
VTLTQEKSQDLKETLTEAEGLLVSYTRKTYQRMAEIDQRLRGKGYPKRMLPENLNPSLVIFEPSNFFT